MRTTSFLVFLCLAACSAAPNPKRPAEPTAWQPPEPSVEQPDADPAQREADVSSAKAALKREEAKTRDAAADTISTAPTATSQATATQGPTDTTIATVAGKPIDVSELLAELMHNSTPEVFDALDSLIIERLVLLEVARLGIEVDAEVADAAYQANVAAIEQLIARSRPNVTLDQFVKEVLGLDPGTYRRRLRRRALHEELAVRAYRAFYLMNDHAMARMIVVPSEEAATAVQARIDAGEDFIAIAREASIDKEEEGERGRKVPVIRSETLMSRLVFQTPVGEIAGPSRELGAFVFVRVEEREPPLAGRWPDIAEAVEGSLATRPIDPLEVEQWKAAMGRRYEVDYSTLFTLAGEPE